MGKVWKSVKKVFKKAAPTIGAVAGGVMGGPMGAAAGAYLGSVLAGNNTRQHLFSAGTAAVASGASSALSGAGQAAAQTGTQTAAQAGTQVAAQAGTQAAAQAGTQAGTQALTQTATKATFTEGVKQFATKYGSSIAAGAATASATMSQQKEDVTMPSVDNSAETEMLRREKEYEKRKRSSLFETKGGAAGERVGYTGSENRGSIFGN